MLRQEVLEWIDKTEYKKELKTYIKLKSRSKHKEEVLECAKYAKSLLESCNLKTRLYETNGNPVVFGERLSSPENPTILVYGHYDVQPEGDLSLWKKDPFVPWDENGKLFGRGSADNKGQHYAHILALRFLNEKYLEVFDKINIKFVLDGDEEVGSYSLPHFFANHGDLLHADFVYISDGPSLSMDKPSVVGSVRGILGFQIKLKLNREDIHSGNFGGLARSSIRTMLDLLTDMINPDGESKIHGFYDKVLPPTSKEREALRNLKEIYDKIIEEKGINRARPIRAASLMEMNQFLPTFNINGIRGGGVELDRRTIIPSEVTASIDCRLVPNLRSSEVKELISTFITNWQREHEIKEGSFSIEWEQPMEAVNSTLSSPYLNIIVDAVRSGFEVEPLIVPRLGGSLPIYLFPEHLKIPSFLVPYALPDENNHAPNENLDLNFFKFGVVSTAKLIMNLSEQ